MIFLIQPSGDAVTQITEQEFKDDSYNHSGYQSYQRGRDTVSNVALQDLHHKYWGGKGQNVDKKTYN